MLTGLTPEQRGAALRSLGICVVYGATAMAVALVYKGVLSVYAYQGKFTMLSMQLVLGLLFCMFAKRFLSRVPGLEVPDFSMAVFRKSLLPGCFFVANIVIGWYGLELVNVPLFLAIRRTTTAFTLLSDFIILGRLASLPVHAAVTLIVGGAVAASWQSLRTDALGLAFTLGNNVCTSVSMSLTKRFSDETHTHGFGIVFYNALVALPICLLGALIKGELSYTLHDFPFVTDVTFWTVLTGASFVGVFMNYIVFLCTTVTSPLATSVTGNVKDIVSTGIGALAFGDFKATVVNVTGLLVSFGGAIMFSIVKVRETAHTAAVEKRHADGRTPTALHNGATATRLEEHAEAPDVCNSNSVTTDVTSPRLLATVGAAPPPLSIVDASSSSGTSSDTSTAAATEASGDVEGGVSRGSSSSTAADTAFLVRRK